MAARDLDVGFTVFSDTRPAVAPMQTLNRVVDQTDKRMVEFGNNLKRRAQKQVKSFGAAVRGATLALAGMAVGLLKTAKVAGEYDRSIRLAALLTKNVGEEFAEFDAGVKQISSDLAILPSQVAKAGQAVGKLGFVGADAMSVLRDGVILARASIGELTSAQAVGSAATILRAFGEDASQSGRAIDILVTGVTSTALAFDKLPTALSTASGFAAAFGATMEETIAILGTTNDIITKTERAATGVRNIFRDLSQVVTKQKLAAAGLNIEIVKQDGTFRGILPILSDMFEQTKKMTDAERLQTLQRGFTVESAGALFAITKRLEVGFRDQNGQLVKGVAGLQVLVDRMGTVGTASALADVQLKGFAGAMEKFKTEGALLAVELGAALSKTLVPALGFVTGLITDLKESIANASPTVKTMIGVFGIAAIVLGIVGGVLIASSLAMGGWTFITGLATGANLAFLASLGPIVIAIGAVVGLVILFAKQLKFLFAQVLKFRQFIGFGAPGDEERIAELEGRGRIDEEGSAKATVSLGPEAIRSGALSAESIGAAGAPVKRRERTAVEAGGTREEISERVRGAFAGGQERAVGDARGDGATTITLEMDSKKVGEAIIERQRRESRRMFRRMAF